MCEQVVFSELEICNIITVLFTVSGSVS